jgi:hypothetical protein
MRPSRVSGRWPSSHVFGRVAGADATHVPRNCRSTKATFGCVGLASPTVAHASPTLVVIT